MQSAYSGSHSLAPIIRDYELLGEIIAAHRKLAALTKKEFRVVATSGTFDMLHEGHTRYVTKARQQGHFLVIAVDSDAKTRKQKGAGRPLVEQEARMEILANLRSVDLVFLKELNDPHWQFIKTVHPDVLIATQGHYSPEEITELEASLCSKVVVLEPQAATSTTALLRKSIIEHLGELEEEIAGAKTTILDAIERVEGWLRRLRHGGK